MLSRGAQKVLKQLRKVCLALPETSEVMQFGSPVWRAGKKSFCGIHRYGGRLRLSFWVGAEMQAALGLDPRYRMAPYSGHNGWIELDVEESIDWDEVNELVLISYRHFALQRMLKALDAGG
jgi:predicted DNA-binding protein (MmcQ/YjbR family)